MLTIWPGLKKNTDESWGNWRKYFESSVAILWKVLAPMVNERVSPAVFEIRLLCKAMGRLRQHAKVTLSLAWVMEQGKFLQSRVTIIFYSFQFLIVPLWEHRNNLFHSLAQVPNQVSWNEFSWLLASDQMHVRLSWSLRKAFSNCCFSSYSRNCIIFSIPKVIVQGELSN